MHTACTGEGHRQYARPSTIRLLERPQPNCVFDAVTGRSTSTDLFLPETGLGRLGIGCQSHGRNSTFHEFVQRAVMSSFHPPGRSVLNRPTVSVPTLPRHMRWAGLPTGSTTRSVIFSTALFPPFRQDSNTPSPRVTASHERYDPAIWLRPFSFGRCPLPFIPTCPSWGPKPTPARPFVG